MRAVDERYNYHPPTNGIQIDIGSKEVRRPPRRYYFSKLFTIYTVVYSRFWRYGPRRDDKKRGVVKCVNCEGKVDSLTIRI